MRDTSNNLEGSPNDSKPNDSNTPPSSEHKKILQSRWLRLTPSPSSDRDELMQKLHNVLQEKARLEKEWQDAKDEIAKMKKLVESKRPKKDVQQITERGPLTIKIVESLNQRLQQTVKKLEEESEQLGGVIRQRDRRIEQLEKEIEELQREAER